MRHDAHFWDWWFFHLRRIMKEAEPPQHSSSLDVTVLGDTIRDGVLGSRRRDPPRQQELL